MKREGVEVVVVIFEGVDFWVKSDLGEKIKRAVGKIFYLILILIFDGVRKKGKASRSLKDSS